ncbi:MAG: condensation domain-containing protein, partial [Bryobacteraceae bacterium]
RALLQESSRAYHTQINDLLLAALTLAFQDWTGADRLLVELESHGRQHPAIELDVTQTVGWFTAIYPVVLSAASSLQDTIKQVKEQLRRVPSFGVHWGALRYGSAGSEARDRLASLPKAEVLFNYLGQTGDVLPRDSEWKPLMHAGGSGRSPRQKRDHLLEINALVEGGRLQVIWSYSRRVHRRQTVEQLAWSYRERLDDAIKNCAEAASSAFTPSDVPAARVSQTTLDALAAEMPLGVEDAYELTPAQLGMLFHSIYEPTAGAYLNQLTCGIQGSLDERLFREAWRTVLEHHAALRTTYHWRGIEKPLQVVRRRAPLPWRFEDWRGSPGRALDEELEQDRALGFDLAQAPLMRFSLFRMGEQNWRFQWTQHHLLLDGWSSALILNQVVQSYAALAAGRSRTLPIARPFRDHILWLQAQDASLAGRFWRDELSGFHTPTPLVLGRPEIDGTAGAGRMSEEEAQMGKSESANLAAFAQNHGITLNTL